MPSLARIGGSIYWAIGLSLAAWAAREGRQYIVQLRNGRERRGSLGRYHAPLSAASVKRLVSQSKRAQFACFTSSSVLSPASGCYETGAFLDN